jgi:hypothetical protein
MPKPVFAALLIVLIWSNAALPQKAPPIYFSYDQSNFTATGHWTPAGGKDLSSIPSETEIDCFKQGLSCVEATAEYYSGHPHITINYLQVVRWDDNGIIASDSSGICMTVALQVSFAEQRVSATHSMKQLNDKTKEACNYFGAQKTEEEIFVLKGSPRWTKEHALFPEKPSNK